MKTSATRIALGLFIAVATLGISKGAHAQTWAHWRNQVEPGGVPLYLGVSGGPFCTPTRGCGYTAGTHIILWTSTTSGDQNWLTSFPGTGNVQNEFGDPGTGDPWDLAVYGDYTANSTYVVIEPPTVNSAIWTITRAEDLGAPYTGCFAFINQNSGKAMVVYQGNVYKGASVVQYDLCTPTNNLCGNPSHAWHPDQFWCPETF